MNWAFVGQELEVGAVSGIVTTSTKHLFKSKAVLFLFGFRDMSFTNTLNITKFLRTSDYINNNTKQFSKASGMLEQRK